MRARSHKAILGGKRVTIIRVAAVAPRCLSSILNNSDYFRQLDESAKLRYSEKLNSIGLQVDDLYTLQERV